MSRYLSFILTIFLSSQTYATTDLDSLYKELDNTLKNKAIFEKEKLNNIQNIKNLLKNDNLSAVQKTEIHNQLIDIYKNFNFDSTLAYINRNLELRTEIEDSDLIINCELDQCYILAFSGRYIEALNILQLINYHNLNTNLKIKYLNIQEQIYSDIFVYTTSPNIAEQYVKLSRETTDSLYKYLDKNSGIYLAIKEKELRDNRKLDLCEEVNTLRLAKAKMGTSEYSLITFERSLIYQLQDKKDLEKKYLILSAISDIQAAIKDNASLTRLALLLYEEGKINRAYHYIQHSFDDANFFNSRLRFLSISNVLPLITEAYQAKSDKQNKALRFSLFLISILSIALIWGLIFLAKRKNQLSLTKSDLQKVNEKYHAANIDLKISNKELKSLNKAYQETNKVKEHYIGSYLTICSEYIDKLDSFRKLVNKHIKKREIEALYSKTKHNQMVEDEMKEYYESFDNTFLHIFPDFVEEFNKLLEDEAKIELSNPGKLNTELRIFALVRLGITDSSKIANLLRYSVNTIYNYRVKLRNAAIVPRDEFKEYVMKIGVTEDFD